MSPVKLVSSLPIQSRTIEKENHSYFVESIRSVRSSVASSSKSVTKWISQKAKNDMDQKRSQMYGIDSTKRRRTSKSSKKTKPFFPLKLDLGLQAVQQSINGLVVATASFSSHMNSVFNPAARKRQLHHYPLLRTRAVPSCSTSDSQEVTTVQCSHCSRNRDVVSCSMCPTCPNFFICEKCVLLRKHHHLTIPCNMSDLDRFPRRRIVPPKLSSVPPQERKIPSSRAIKKRKPSSAYQQKNIPCMSSIQKTPITNLEEPLCGSTSKKTTPSITPPSMKQPQLLSSSTPSRIHSTCSEVKKPSDDSTYHTIPRKIESLPRSCERKEKLVGSMKVENPPWMQNLSTPMNVTEKDPSGEEKIPFWLAAEAIPRFSRLSSGSSVSIHSSNCHILEKVSEDVVHDCAAHERCDSLSTDRLFAHPIQWMDDACELFSLSEGLSESCSDRERTVSIPDSFFDLFMSTSAENELNSCSFDLIE